MVKKLQSKSLKKGKNSFVKSPLLILVVASLVGILGASIYRYSYAAGNAPPPQGATHMGIYYGYDGQYDRYARAFPDGHVVSGVERYRKVSSSTLVSVDSNTCWRIYGGTGFKHQGHATIWLGQIAC